MIKISICEYCRDKFSYNNKDSKGKFCSQRCHYASKNERMTCVECKKEFIKRKKDMRKSCSTDCFKARRMKITKPRVKDPISPEIPEKKQIIIQEAKVDVKTKPLFYDILDRIKDIFAKMSS